MTSEDSQQPVIDFLSDPANHGGASVKRIDTHIASVFLAGERALKIKRAVRFPFLDFSTLKARRMACEAEIAVNRAFAPSIYRRVLAITREINGYLALAGKGEEPALLGVADVKEVGARQNRGRIVELHARPILPTPDATSPRRRSARWIRVSAQRPDIDDSA